MRAGRAAKIVYLFLMAASVVVAILLKYAFEDHLSKFYAFLACDSGTQCLGNQAVYRVSFGTALFFLFVSIGTFLNHDFHYDWWCIKICAFFGLIVMSFFIPNSFYNVYSEIARVISLFFLLLQIFILVDLAYDIHDYLLLNMKDDDKPDEVKNDCLWKTLYLLASFVLVAGSISGAGVLYHYFGECSREQFFISFNLILGLIAFFASLRIGAGVLVPGVVFGYCTYLTWQAVYSDPNSICNAYNQNYDNPGMVILGLIITASSLTYTSWSAGVAAPNLFKMHSTEEENKTDVVPSKDVEKDVEMEGGKEAKASSVSADGEEKPSYAFFHMVMAMGSVFMAMLLTNWGHSNGGGQSSNADVSVESMWIKIVSSWLTYILFFWTIFAPMLFPDRDFSDKHNTFRTQSDNNE